MRSRRAEIRDQEEARQRMEDEGSRMAVDYEDEDPPSHRSYGEAGEDDSEGSSRKRAKASVKSARS